MHWVKVAIATAAMVVAAGPRAISATLSAAPNTLEEIVGRARPGDTIKLMPGEYRDIRISKRRFQPGITLDANNAILSGLIIADSDGIAIRGGEFHPPPSVTNSSGAQIDAMALRLDRSAHVSIRNSRFVGPGHPDAGGGLVYGEGYGVFVVGGASLVVEESSFAGLYIGVVISKMDDFRVSNITSTFMRSDGIDVAESHHGVIEGVQCSGTVIRDKEHPDCIQLWSRPTSQPTSDIVIRHNSVVGNTQGISVFDHAEGGFDRITIEDNDVNVSYPPGITLNNSRDSIVRRNHVRTLGNARYMANLLAPGAKTCGNVVGPGGGKPGFSDGKC